MAASGLASASRHLLGKCCYPQVELAVRADLCAGRPCSLRSDKFKLVTPQLRAVKIPRIQLNYGSGLLNLLTADVQHHARLQGGQAFTGSGYCPQSMGWGKYCTEKFCLGETLKNELTIEVFSPLRAVCQSAGYQFAGHHEKARLTSLGRPGCCSSVGTAKAQLLSGGWQRGSQRYQFQYHARFLLRSAFAQHPLDPYHPAHKHSAITKEDVSVLTIDRDHLDLVLTWEQVNYMVTDLLRKTPPNATGCIACWNPACSPRFRLPPTFSGCLPISNRFRPAGQSDRARGEEGDRFYVVEHGTARITRHIQRRGRAGHSGNRATFGEEALIGGTVRNATVTMVTDSSLMWLGKINLPVCCDPVIKTISLTKSDGLRKKGRSASSTIRLRGEYKHSHIEEAESFP